MGPEASVGLSEAALGSEVGDTLGGEAGSEVPVDSRAVVEACDTDAKGGEASAGRPVGVEAASEVSAKVS